LAPGAEETAVQESVEGSGADEAETQEIIVDEAAAVDPQAEDPSPTRGE
jgi:hypothetical protein